MPMSHPVLAFALVLSLAACQADLVSTPPPHTRSTVLVTNATCQAGHCMTIEMRAFVTTFVVPQPPTGARALADVGPGEWCIELPDTMSLRVIGPDLTGKIDTTVYRWSDSSGISLIAVDSALWRGQPTQAGLDSARLAIYPYDGIGPAIGETVIFAPGTSPGWAVTFPSAPPLGGSIVKAARCKP